MNIISWISRRSLSAALAIAASLLLLLATAQAFASPAMNSSLSVSTVAVGSKVNLTTQLPAVSDVGLATQEIIQDIDATKVRLTGASDIIAPQGWTLSYSTDGTNFSATPSSWAAVVKVKATGSIKSGGTNAQGDQLFSNTVTSPGTTTTPNGATRSGGDGWDVEFDSRGYIYNWYHHGALSSGLDCRDRFTGLLCEGNWPMALSSSGFYSNFQSTTFFDEVNKHLWLPAADRSTGTGFLCVDVADVKTPVLCGGSKATAWNMVNARANANETSIEQIHAAQGKIYSWDIVSGKILCFDYLANSGMGAACSNMPAITVTAGSANALLQNPTSSMTYFRSAFGNVYAQLNTGVACFNATTMEKCVGWANYTQTLTTGSGHAMYLQPNAAGEIIGVCTATNSKCFAANGTTFATTPAVQTALNNGNMGRWQDSMITVGTKFIFATLWDRPSTIFCYDFATSSACSSWPASTYNGITGMGQISGSRVYTFDLDPLNSDCLWTNSDGGSPMIGQIAISSGVKSCSITMATSTFNQADLVSPRVTCDAATGLGYNRFTLTGLTRGSDYTSASLTISKSNGSVLVSGGTTWQNVAFNAQDYVDLSTIVASDLGQGAVFKINYVGKTSTSNAVGTLIMKSDSAQLCLSLTANLICPNTTLIGTPSGSQTTFSATGATINAASVRTEHSSTSGTLNIDAPLASQCGFSMKSVVGQGDKAQAFPATLRPVPNAVATLLDSSGNVLNGVDGQPIKATSDASGNLDFGVVKAGTYKVRFEDFPLVNGVGAGDIAMVYRSPFTYSGGNFTMTGQNPVVFTNIQSPLDSPTVTGTAGGADVVVKAAYTMRAVANPDVVSVKSDSMSTIDVLLNDTPTTDDSFTTSSLKICAAGTTTNCTLTTLTVANEGTYGISSGKITFTPVAGFTGPATQIAYQISDSFSNTPQTVNSTLNVTAVPAPTAVADTLSGNTLAPITVDVTENDTAASGATLNKASVKLCSSGTSTGCNQTTVAIASKGTYSVNNLGVVTFTPDAGFVGAVPALTYSINDSVGNTSTNTVTATVTNTPPRLTTAAFEPAKLGISATFSQTITQGSGIIPATGGWAVVGSVPPGMIFNTNTGAISGTPTTPGTYEFTVEVTDVNGLKSSKVESILVAAPPVITTSPLTYKLYKDEVASIPGSATQGTGPIPASGAWTATGLPTGLTHNTANGNISGTPTQTGTFTVTQRVTDENTLFDEEVITIKVVTRPVITTPALPSLEANVLVTPIQQTKTLGTAALPATGAWEIISGTLPAGLSFNPNTGEITGTPTAIGTFPITVKLTDLDGEVSQQVQTLKVNNPPVITTSPLTYKLYKDQASNIPSSATAGTGALQTNGWTATGLPNGMSINPATGAISGTPTATGTFTVTQKVTDVNDLFDVEVLTVNVVAKPIITTPALPSFQVNTEITPVAQTKNVGSAVLPATGAWSIVAGTLPDGLSFNSDTGAITGTPTQVGTYPITVKLMDVDGEFSQQVQTIKVNTPPLITTTPLTHKLYVGVAANLPSTATAGTGALQANGWTATGLPNGMSINPATGAISGTPSATGNFAIIQKVTDVNNLFDVETINVTVIAKPVITTTVPLPKLVLNAVATPITQTKTAGSAAIPATGAWSITSGTLPAGLSMNPDTGAISGTPTVSGSFPITVKLIDADGEFTTKEETVEVIAPPVITTTPTARTLNINVLGSIANTTTNGSADISPFNGWTATGLPQGLNINGITGVISGTPTTLGTYPVTVRATDLNGLFDEEVLNITIVNGPVITTQPTSYTFGVGNDLKFIADDFFAGNSVLSRSREIVNTATKGSADIRTTAGWSAVGLPAGLTMNPDTGKISGAATTVGVYPVDVKVTDTAGFSSTKTLTINIVQGPKNTTPRVYTYELDIKKRIGIKVYDVKQTWTLGSADLARGVPFFVQGPEPAPVSGVSIVSGEITILPYLNQVAGKEKYGAYTLKTVILDRNGAYDLATFTINLVKPGSNITTLPLPKGITDGMQMTTSTYPLAGTSSAKLPVTYTSSTPSVCTVDSAKKTMKMVNEGKCTINASSGTGSKLSKASQTFTITKLPQTISIVAPGELIPGGILTAPMPTDDPNGFKLYANATSALTPKYESLDPNICSIDVNGLVIWDADLTITPRVESDFSCRVKVTQPGDTTYSAAPPQTITLVATHVEPPAPEGGVAKEPAQSASLPAAGGTTPLLGGTGFKVIVDSKKKTVTVQPMSKGRWIGPIYADITIKHLPKGSATPYVQTCKRNYFGIAIYNSKKAMVAPPLGGDNMVVPELPTYKTAVTALIKQYQAMPGKFATTKVVKGKKVVTPGYLDWKPLFGQTTCVLDAKTYAAWKSGIQIEAKATVTRDRRWPTTYAKYKSYDWKNKSNNGLIFPTVVEWNLKIG